MISIIPTYNKKFRTFGWVQNPSNFRSLCDVVAIFDFNSVKYDTLLNHTVKELVLQSDGRDDLISTLNLRPLKIKYAHLVGTSFTPRSSARCNGIVQATVKGQGRDFIDDWSADGFVRWAHCFGFIKYDYETDTFEITDAGLALSSARTESYELNGIEQELLINAILSYPPAIRVLSLLSPEGTHLTKFEIGKKLGFVGEDGFTSMPQTTFLRSLANIESTREKNKMKANWEGSSDKYARMIAKWLTKLGLVEQIPKKVTVSIGNNLYSESIGQAYIITAQGLTAFNRSLGRSRHARIYKNVCFEMLATKGNDREYLRTRRALVIKYLTEHKKYISSNEIRDFLSAYKINETNESICDDIQGLINIGLNINVNGFSYQWNDSINDFIIPIPQSLSKSTLTEYKNEIRSKLSKLSYEYLSLIDLAYDSSQNRLFEMKTIELLTEECKYDGIHLGGGFRPDGIIYSDSLEDNYGVIVDTKAYSNGYNLPTSQCDAMVRYIEDNQNRNANINPTKWWDNFDKDISSFYFMFVSGHFIGNYKTQLARIAARTNTKGNAIGVGNLLVYADKIVCGDWNHDDFRDEVFSDIDTEIFFL